MEEEIIKPVLLSIVGPTAVGKTSLAIRLASDLDTEIISADSRQFYREMTIGTAKPDASELKQIKHHFIDSNSINELYSAGEFGRDAHDLLKKLYGTKEIVVAVGGSGLYLKALWEGFDEMPDVSEGVREKLNDELKKSGLQKLLEELKEKDEAYYSEVDKSNHQRVVRALEVIRSTGQPFSSYRRQRKNELFYRNIKVGLNMDREHLFDRINERMDLMIEAGLFREATGLLPYKDHNALQTVGYTEIFDFLDGRYDKEEAIRLLKRNSRRYAKRQMTWFRKYEDIRWFHPDLYDDIIKFVKAEIQTNE